MSTESNCFLAEGHSIYDNPSPNPNPNLDPDPNTNPNPNPNTDYHIGKQLLSPRSCNEPIDRGESMLSIRDLMMPGLEEGSEAGESEEEEEEEEEEEGEGEGKEEGMLILAPNQAANRHYNHHHQPTNHIANHTQNLKLLPGGHYLNQRSFMTLSRDRHHQGSSLADEIQLLADDHNHDKLYNHSSSHNSNDQNSSNADITRGTQLSISSSSMSNYIDCHYNKRNDQGVHREISCLRGVNYGSTFNDQQLNANDVVMLERSGSLITSISNNNNSNSNGNNNNNVIHKKTGITKGQWTAEEDRYLKKLVEQYGERKWSVIAQHLQGRIGKQCRERWQNHLRPHIKRDCWTEEEEKLLISLHRKLGSKWAAIAKLIPGRTENNIKNVWNATKRRKDARRGKPPRSNVKKLGGTSATSSLSTHGVNNKLPRESGTNSSSSSEPVPGKARRSTILRDYILETEALKKKKGHHHHHYHNHNNNNYGSCILTDDRTETSLHRPTNEERGDDVIRASGDSGMLSSNQHLLAAQRTLLYGEAQQHLMLLHAANADGARIVEKLTRPTSSNLTAQQLYDPYSLSISSVQCSPGTVSSSATEHSSSSNVHSATNIDAWDDTHDLNLSSHPNPNHIVNHFHSNQYSSSSKFPAPSLLLASNNLSLIDYRHCENSSAYSMPADVKHVQTCHREQSARSSTPDDLVVPPVASTDMIPPLHVRASTTTPSDAHLMLIDDDLTAFIANSTRVAKTGQRRDDKTDNDNYHSTNSDKHDHDNMTNHEWAMIGSIDDQASSFSGLIQDIIGSSTNNSNSINENVGIIQESLMNMSDEGLMVNRSIHCQYHDKARDWVNPADHQIIHPTAPPFLDESDAGDQLIYGLYTWPPLTTHPAIYHNGVNSNVNDDGRKQEEMDECLGDVIMQVDPIMDWSSISLNIGSARSDTITRFPQLPPREYDYIHPGQTSPPYMNLADRPEVDLYEMFCHVPKGAI